MLTTGFFIFCSIISDIALAYVPTAQYGIIPSVRSLVKIADYADISLEFLIGKTDNNYFIKNKFPTQSKNRVIQLKNKRQLSYADITNQCSFAGNSLHIWIARNNIPEFDYLLQLAKVFNVSPDYLLGRTDYKK